MTWFLLPSRRFCSRLALATVSCVGPCLGSIASAQTALPATDGGALPPDGFVGGRSAAEGGAPESAPPSLAEVLVGDAKSDYESGRTLYRAGDYAGALARFRSAARASQDPRLWWDEAACEAALAHYANAGRLMRRYLDSHSPLISPAAAEKAQDFLGETESRTARIDVANEPDAEVSIDDEPVGPIPSPSNVRVDLGVHRVRLTKPGFADATVIVMVSTTADIHVTTILVPLVRSGRLVVRAGTRDAIAIDGKLVGAQAWTGGLPVGLYQLRVTGADSIPYEVQVTIEEGQTRSIDVTLRPARHAAVPPWFWIAGGTVLALGAVTAGYFLLRSPESTNKPIDGSLGTAALPLRLGSP
jgi:hypothetical protein